MKVTSTSTVHKELKEAMIQAIDEGLLPYESLSNFYDIKMEKELKKIGIEVEIK